jgi:hypothetical protein
LDEGNNLGSLVDSFPFQKHPVQDSHLSLYISHTQDKVLCYLLALVSLLLTQASMPPRKQINDITLPSRKKESPKPIRAKK